MIVNKRDVDLSFEKVKESIVFRVIGENKLRDYKNKNAGNVLYSLVGNEMYMIYVIEIDKNASIVFTDMLMEKLGSSEEEIIKLAKKNTEKIYPPVLKNVENAILETIAMKEHDDDNLEMKNLLKYRSNNNLLEAEQMTLSHSEGEQMHVLTNSQTKYGAGVIFYDGILRKVSKIFGDDLFLIPSSIHEIILLPRYANVTEDELNIILNDVNDGFLNDDEILGLHVMVYDAKTGKIKG